MDLIKISRKMSMLLRHRPEKENLVLDSEGYTDVEPLLKALNIDKKTLDEIVSTDNKNRYSYNKDGTKIRANQGHSVKNVNIKFKKFTSTQKLYHGTAKKYLEGIDKSGLKPQTRQYVHLSKDIETATNVGMRHAKSRINLVIYEIDTKTMLKDGYIFYESDNGVVLIEAVPKKYMKRII